ncbi:hypothetical protein [Franconibacter pulveris]|uniref:hypothetical protein n=1 Tax=Franconibacter pulveris TaxID=435910 RepID=UPI000A7C9BA7|nr:hypothetical protein [Franconibacter pulveris]
MADASRASRLLIDLLNKVFYYRKPVIGYVIKNQLRYLLAKSWQPGHLSLPQKRLKACLITIQNFNKKRN